MSQPFIDLGRTFLPIQLSSATELEHIEIRSDLREGSALVWRQLFQKWRVVILAEPGAGKTQEFRAAKALLKTEGKHAFFCPIEALLEYSVEDSVEYSDRDNFRDWITSEEEAWFFLDSVDEARLDSPKAFKRALRRFSREIEPALGRVHTVISCRVGDWLATTDKALVAQELHIPSQEPEQNKATITSYSSHLVSVADKDVPQKIRLSSVIARQEKGEGEEETAIAVYQLSPLTWGQIQAFIEFMNISDSSTFLSAIEKQHLISFAERPQDLLDLIAYWKEYSQFDSYQQMMEFNIDAKLREEQPFHDQQNPLSAEQARQGAERIAAAITFTRKKSILLSDRASEPSLRALSIQPKDVMKEWQPQRINTLLSRPIFDEALYGSVQFHHRSIREYLTACWLSGLLQISKARQSINNLIFVQKYGRSVVAPSMRPIAAWIALWDEEVRDHLCSEFPEILINYGDAASLDVVTRGRLLENFVAQYERRKRLGIYIESISIRRLASPEIADTTKKLLSRYAHHDEICQILLRLALEGEMSGAVDTILSIVSIATIDRRTRSLATRAVVELGNSASHRALIDVLSSQNVGYVDAQFVGELIPALYPNTVNVDVLISLLSRVEISSDFSMFTLERHLEVLITSESDEEQVKKLLAGLCNLLKTPPFTDNDHYRISQRYAWLEPYAMQCADKWILRRDPYALEPIVLGLFLRCISGRIYFPQTSGKQEDFLGRLKEWDEFCYRLFWYAFKELRVEYGEKNKPLPRQWWRVSYELRGFWKPTECNTEDLFECLATAEPVESCFIALSALWDIYVNTGRKRKLIERLKKAVLREQSLHNQLQKLLHPPRLSDEEKKYRATERRLKSSASKEVKKREDNKQSWKDTLPKWLETLREVKDAEIGSVFNSTWYLYGQLEGSRNSGSWGRANWEALVPEFGKPVAEAFRDGCRKYWRAYDPFSQEDWMTSSSIPAARMIGLTGVAIEARESASWLDELAELEAKHAVHYSILELNGFPDWFPVLHSKFSEAVDKVVKDVLAYELGEDGHNCTRAMLSRLRWNDGNFQEYYQSFIVHTLEDKKIQSISTLGDILPIILFNANNSNYRKKLGQMLLFQLSVSEDTVVRCKLLCALMYVDATAGLSELKRLVSTLNGQKLKDKLVAQFCANLVAHRQPAFRINSPDYQRIGILKELVLFIYQYVRPEEDIYHEGGYTPRLRDEAQQARSYLVSLITDMSGEAAHDAIVSLIEILEDSPHKDYLIHLAEERAAIDAEGNSWQGREVFEFETRFERDRSNRSVTITGDVFNSKIIAGDDNTLS